MTSNKLTQAQMSKTYGITPRTVHYYESLDLIQSEKIGRQRLYGRKAQARMTLTLRGRRFGISLEAIRQWLEIFDRKGTVPQLKAWLPMADHQLGMLQEKLGELSVIIVELRQSRDEAIAQIAQTDDEHLSQERPE